MAALEAFACALNDAAVSTGDAALDAIAARFHAEEALKLATCDGPPYYYKVAYEEAEAMLEKLK